MILVALLLASFLINLDTTLVNVALPDLTRELHATTTQLQWVVDAYNLVFAALILTFGSLSDRFGRKGMLLAGLAVVGTASLAGAFTTSPARADRGQGGDGPRRRDDLPGDVVAAHERVHRTAGARCRDRPVGRDRGGGDRAGADRRRLAAAGLQLGQHLRRHGPGGGAGAGRGGRRGSRVQEPGCGPARRSRAGAVVADDGAAGLHDHRGPGLRMDGGPQPGGLRGLGGAAGRVHRGRAAGPASDAGRAALPQPAVQRRQRGGHGVLLHPARLHLPDHPVFPVRPRLQRAVGRRPAAPGRARGRDRVGRGHPARGAGPAPSSSSRSGSSRWRCSTAGWRRRRARR